jgi:hypothetical protein
MMKKILLGVVASVLCAAAGAEERGALMEFLHGTYNGGAFGHTTISNYCQAGAYTCNDQRDVSFKVYGGLRMTDYLGSEVGFMSFGRIRASSQPNGAFGSVYERSTRTNGFVFNVAPSVRLTPDISFIGRVGLARWHIEGNDGSTSISESKTAPYLGAALNYKIHNFLPDAFMPALRNLGVELAWDATRTEFLNADHWFSMVSIGTSLEF